MTESGPFLNDCCPSCIDDYCGNGAGHEIGILPVTEGKHDDVIHFIHQHNLQHPDGFHYCIICATLSDVCDECGLHEGMMSEEDAEAHLIVDGVVLIGCEGYHEPVFRVGAILMEQGNG